VQSGQVFRLILCERRQSKQQVGLKPGIEESPHYDVSHTVTLFKELVHVLAVSWVYCARASKYRRLSDKKFINQCLLTIGWLTFIINQSVVNIYI
jgi:trehalose utilization protein